MAAKKGSPGRPASNPNADQQVRLKCLEFAFRCFPTTPSLIDQDKVFDLARRFEEFVDTGN